MPPPTRPATISELDTAAAETSSSNSNADLKNLLRRAEGHRRTGGPGVYMARTTGGSSGAATSTDIGLDLEHAFIEYARAATLIVETVPAHREYSTGLNAEQRANLKAVTWGRDISHFTFFAPQPAARWPLSALAPAAIDGSLPLRLLALALSPV
ncbi:hypothetical protein B0H13DRAFT_1917096 [Mycena leptocephala]|nr:hypothetical protein B0H13DRAFT_1917096 [Mycena leptocephala]